MMPVRLMVNLRSQLTQLPLEGIGLVHGDFELDNLKWSHGIPTAFDFDEAAVSWFAADVAIAVRDIADRPELLAAFLSGYRSVRALTTDPSTWFRSSVSSLHPDFVVGAGPLGFGRNVDCGGLG